MTSITPADLKDMPMVTVEDCLRFKEAAMGEIDRLERHVEILQSKIYPEYSCACGFDDPDDVCAHHKALNGGNSSDRL